MWRENAELNKLTESVIGVVETDFDHLSVDNAERLKSFAIVEKRKRRVISYRIVRGIRRRRKEMEWVRRRRNGERRTREHHLLLLTYRCFQRKFSLPPHLKSQIAHGLCLGL